MKTSQPFRLRSCGPELLESRIAPATLVNPSTVAYQDADGDDVTVKFSKPILTGANASAVFLFDSGSVSGSNATPQQLFEINLNALANPADAAGVSITVSATRSPSHGGDGFAAVGFIKATNLPLGNVTVDGDLGQLEAGAGASGVQSLNVASLGAHGLSTQEGGDLTTTITGNVGKIVVKGNIQDAYIQLLGANTLTKSVAVGGSIYGGTAAGSGRIYSDGTIGALNIGGSLIGGTGDESGKIYASKLGSVTIGGSVIGSTDNSADSVGSIHAVTELGSVAIKHDLIGGSAGTGRITCKGSIGNITIGGSVIGVSTESGGIESGIAGTGNGGVIKIGGSLVAGPGDDSGKIVVRGKLAGLVVGGSIKGGAGNYNTSEDASAQIVVAGDTGAVKIGGSLLGDAGFGTGSLLFSGNVKSLTVGGSITAGSNVSSGNVFAGDLGPVKIGGNLDATGDNTDGRQGAIAARNIASLTIGGSVLAGVIDADERIGAIKIAGDVIGTAASKVRINAGGKPVPGAKADVAIASLFVGGSVENALVLGGYTGGTGNYSNPDAQIGAVTVKGMWIASSLVAGVRDVNGDGFGNADDVKIASMNDNANIVSRIASITIGGIAAGTSGGADHYGFTAQQIGSFKVGGTAFKLTPGAANDTDPLSALLAVGITDDLRIREVPL